MQRKKNKIVLVGLVIIIICSCIPNHICSDSINELGDSQLADSNESRAFEIEQFVTTEKNQWYIKNDGNELRLGDYSESWDYEKSNMIKGVDIKYVDITSHEKRTCIIAVIDSGGNVDNMQFCNIWKNCNEIQNNGLDDDNNGFIDDYYGWNFVGNNNNLYYREESFHGNFITSILCKHSDDYQGLLDTDYAQIMVIKALQGYENIGTIENIIDAIEYAEKNGAVICNLSVNCVESEELKNAIDSSSMLFVVPAGNLGEEITSSNEIYPCYYKLDNVITVSDLRADSQLSCTSNYSKSYVDIAAPGTDIYGNLYDDCYGYLSGTSFATPIVTAASAMCYMLSDEELEAHSIKKIVCSNVTKNDCLTEKVSCGGYVNFKKIMDYLDP